MSTEKRVPEIRFKGFSGEWNYFSLEEISDVLDGDRGHNYPNGEDLKEQGHTLFLNASNVTKNGFKFDTRQYITKEKSDSLGNGKLFLGDIVLTSRGSIGHIAWYNEDVTKKIPFARINSGMLILRVKDHIAPSVISQYLKSPKGKKKIEGISFGSAQPQLTKASVSKFSISIPIEKTEQTAIGNTFQKLDSLINQHQQKHDKLSNLKKAMLEKMFPKQGETTPEIRFKGFSGEWEEKPICDLFTVTRGNVLAATKTSPAPTPEKRFPVYSSQTKNNGLMGFYDKYLFENAITWTTDGANAGTVNFREGQFYSTNVNGVLLSDEGYANKAIAEILNKEAWKHVSHVGNPKLMNNVMSAIKITIPTSIEEQTAIGNYFQKLDTLINQHQQQITKLNNIKQACLSKMFV